MRRLPKTAWFCMAITLACAAASAHELRPAYLDLLETSPGEFAVLWKTPMRGEMQLSLTPEFSGETTVASDVSTRARSGAAIQEWTLHAPALRGQGVRIRGLESTMTDTVVRIVFVDGTEWTHLLTPRAPSTVIPEIQENIETLAPRTGTPYFPLFAAIAAWGVMCLAAGAARMQRGQAGRWAIVSVAYATGIGGAFFLLREVVNWGVLH